MFSQYMASTSNQSIRTSNSKINVIFSGQTIETTVTVKESMVDAWVTEILSIHDGKIIILGLDCEWRCIDYWGLFTKVATLQLCVDSKRLIIQMAYMDYFPQSMVSFLDDCNVTCVGVEVDQDVARLRREYGLVCCSTADTRELAANVGNMLMCLFGNLGLKDLACCVVGLVMEKPIHVCKSDWQTRFLSNEQIRYACIDAYVFYRIGRKLLLGN